MRRRRRRSNTITDRRRGADAERSTAGTRRRFERFRTSGDNRPLAFQLCRYGRSAMIKTLSTMAGAAILIAGTSSLALGQYASQPAPTAPPAAAYAPSNPVSGAAAGGAAGAAAGGAAAGPAGGAVGGAVGTATGAAAGTANAAAGAPVAATPAPPMSGSSMPPASGSSTPPTSHSCPAGEVAYLNYCYPAH